MLTAFVIGAGEYSLISIFDRIETALTSCKLHPDRINPKYNYKTIYFSLLIAGKHVVVSAHEEKRVHVLEAHSFGGSAI